MFAPPAANLCVGEKMNLKKGGGEKNDQNAQYISLVAGLIDIFSKIYIYRCSAYKHYYLTLYIFQNNVFYV